MCLKHDKVLRRNAGADTALFFAKGHIQDPMQGVFNPPVAPTRFCVLHGGKLLTQYVETILHTLLPLDYTDAP